MSRLVDSVRLRWRLFALAFLVVVACSAARSVVVDVAPTTPARTACAVGAGRCNGLVPERCAQDETASTVTRWWPAHGLVSDGTATAPCASRCVVDGMPAVAHCAGPVDAGTDATDGAP